MAGMTGKYPETDRYARWIAGALVALAALFKFGLLGRGAFPFNADEAIVALMARHTLQGEWPIFFYGQAYMGSLDATFVALGFRLLGERVIVIRLIQSLLYCGTVLTTILLGWRLFQNRIAGLAAGLVLAIPTTNLTLYTTISLGGYGEALLLGNLILLTGIVATRQKTRFLTNLLLGFLMGLGFWAFGLTLVYSGPVVLLLLRHLRGSGSSSRWRAISGVLLGVLLGLTPVILWAASHGVRVLVAELGGSAIAGVAGAGYATQVLQSLRNLLFFGISVIFGFRPPWDVVPLFMPGMLLALAFWLTVGIERIRTKDQGKHPADREGKMLLRDLTLFTIMGYVLTPFGADPSGRYFLPLVVVLALLAGDFVAQANWPGATHIRWLLFAGLIFFHFGSNLQVVNQPDPGFTTQFDATTRIDHAYDEELIHFLQAVQATRGYTTYWVSYPLAFQSQEELIFIPALPYHADLRFTERDNRYAPYSQAVSTSQSVAFITTRLEILDRLIGEFLQEKNIHWREVIIGPYHVFYGLSAPIEIQGLMREWRD
jgi:4-amino-4-deoxy-L-arabinose transferase-like glycosyltransferase